MVIQPPADAEPKVIVTHRIVTYFKRPKDQPGITQLGSKRVSSAQALQWLLDYGFEDEDWLLEHTDDDLIIKIRRSALDA